MVQKLLPAVLHAAVVYLVSTASTASGSDSDTPAIAGYFNTKGRYEEVNPHLLDDVLAINLSAVKPPAPACTAQHLTAIIRHGTRFPTSGNIRKIQKLYQLVRSASLADLPELRAWEMWYREEMDGRLVDKGRADHRHLAQRLVKTFPTLLTRDTIREGRVKFITSSTHRCVNSTLAFQQGLKELLNLEGVDMDYTESNALMRFFDTCTRLVETVEKNKKAVVEVTSFNSGPEMKRVQEKLADRLQIPYPNVTMDSVEAAFYLCAYEFTIRGVNSPWCQLFDESDAQVVEYSGDLKHYWKKAFGHDINSKASCILFQDLFSRLNTAANQIKSGQPVSEMVMVQVGHAETLLPLLTLLGLFKDNTTLTSKNFASQLSRAFRCSHIMPYAANLLVVLYDCADGVRLQVRLNERPVTLPGLAGPSPLYEDVRNRYQELLAGCDQDTVCQWSKNTELN